jgi:hypothetical protein
MYNHVQPHLQEWLKDVPRIDMANGSVSGNSDELHPGSDYYQPTLLARRSV